MPTRRKETFFFPGKDHNKIKRWDEAIKRADKTIDHTSAVCDLHFEINDIKKEDIIILPNGEKHVSPYRRWTLANEAVTPTKNLKLRKYLNEKRTVNNIIFIFINQNL